MNKTINAIVEWLHKGYPEGVPPKDFYPLLALLARTLREDELDTIVGRLTAGDPRGEISSVEVHAMIEKVKKEPPVQTDVRDVASRLAAAGWPLGDLDPAGHQRDLADTEGALDSAEDTEHENRPSVTQRVVEWLQTGYPHGVPRTDQVGILALLRRRLTDQEVEQIARSLVSDADGDPIVAADVEALVTEVKQDEPTAEELGRVASHLAAKGWPLEA